MSTANNKSFRKNVMTLITGTALAQLISVIALILLQRYFYGPEDYAPFRLFFEFVAIFTGISALKLENGIILEKDESNARNLANICFKAVLITSLISLISFYIYSKISNQFNAISSNIFMVLLIPISVALSGFIQIFNSYYTRKKSFRLMSINKVVQNSTSAISQLILGALKYNYFGLIIGRVTGLIATNYIFAKKYFSGKSNNLNSNPLNQKELILKNKDFILYTSPGFFIGNMINFILLALFIEYYENNFGGKIAASFQYLGISIAIISSSFSQVYFSEISTINSKEELKSTYTYWIKRLGVIALIGATLIQFVPNWLITSILGENWDGLIEIMSVMALWMAVMFVSSSLSYIYIKLGRQKQILFFDIFHLLLVLGSIVIPHYIFKSEMITLWIFTLAQLFFYIISILAGYYFISKYSEE